MRDSPLQQTSVTAVLKSGQSISEGQPHVEPAILSPLPCLRSFPTETPSASVAEEDIVFICISELSAF